MDFAHLVLPVLQIVWVDLLLSGDNAVVIALACRSLPPAQRKMGIILGTAAAVGLRILFALVISQLMHIPFLRVLGGLLLFWIAIKLARGESAEEHDIPASDKLWKAVRTIAIADAAMSLDNVVAIAAIAGHNYWLFIFGLALSIPLIMLGATLITNLIARFPIIVWAGAALLGWIAGEMIAADEKALAFLGLHLPHGAHYVAAALGAAFVVTVGWWLKSKDAQRSESATK